MDTKQILTFLVAAETLNFTQTAKQLKFAQSSVTAQIKALESEMGVYLFERLGKKIILTEHGYKFKNYAEEVIRLTNSIKQNLCNTEESAIVIGAQESHCIYRLPPVLKEFKSLYPKTKIIFRPAHSDEIVREKLLAGELDVALFMDEYSKPGVLKIKPLIEEEIKVVCSADHPLQFKESVNTEDLLNETLLLTEKGCSYRTIFEKTLQIEDVYPLNKLEFVSIEAIKQCVIANVGIAVLPELVVNKELNKGIIKELHWTSFNSNVITQVAWHKDKVMSKSLESFIEISQKLSKTHKNNKRERS